MELIAKKQNFLLLLIINTYQLFKLRLSIGINVSCIIGYLLGCKEVNVSSIVLLFLGGMLITGSSNIFNQIIERKRDKLMDRTKNRPIPSGRINSSQATIIGIASLIIGCLLLNIIDFRLPLFSILTAISYVFLYTPLKAISPLSVFLGAFPGAFPFILGWVASGSSLNEGAFVMFLMQFIWQFPHFWIIAWILYEDYKKAGYFLLPTIKKNNISLILILTYTICLVLTSLSPYILNIFGIGLSLFSFILVLFLGLFLILSNIEFYIFKTKKFARKFMGICIIYLPLIQLIFVLDKFFFKNIDLWN